MEPVMRKAAQPTPPVTPAAPAVTPAVPANPDDVLNLGDAKDEVATEEPQSFSDQAIEDDF